MTEEDADMGTVGPFVVGVLGLEVVLKNVNWGPKRMEMVKVGLDLGP